MKRIGIVILNYLAYKTTMNTVSAFDMQDSEGYEIFIVIVDNCSPNRSFQELQKEYCGRSNVIVVKTEYNLGFANGNNFGYQELLHHMDPDFVVISNDDILLPQKGLFRWIEESSIKYQYAVLGPDIYSIYADFHQSPLKVFTTDEKKVKKRIFSLHVSLVKCYLKKLFHVIKPYQRPSWKNDFYKEFHDEMTLHGSFQVFSKLYFMDYTEPYDPQTFLYLEEDILKLRCDIKQLKMVYSPDYQVHHLQAVATNMINSTDYEKEIFRLQHRLRSMKVYLKILRTKNRS